MIGKIENDFAVISLSKEIEKQGFGAKRGDKIYLHPIEALYLQLNKKVKFDELENLVSWVQSRVSNFPEAFFVYSDLRMRGYRVRIEGDFILAKKKYYPVSEKKEVDFDDIFEKVVKNRNLVLAIVDEESETTYYEVSEIDLKGEQIENLPKVRGKILNDRVIVESTEFFTKYFYGSLLKEFVVLSIFESFYLHEVGSLEIDFDELKSIAEKINDFYEKYEVYRDLKRRGFVVKTGFKFGCDFRVYRKVETVEDLPHSEFLVLIAKKLLKPQELARAIRVANAVKKVLLIAKRGRYLLFNRVKV